MANQSLAYKAGYLARTNRKVVGDNPYEEHLEAHWQWMNGFVDAGQELK